MHVRRNIPKRANPRGTYFVLDLLNGQYTAHISKELLVQVGLDPEYLAIVGGYHLFYIEKLEINLSSHQVQFILLRNQGDTDGQA